MRGDGTVALQTATNSQKCTMKNSQKYRQLSVARFRVSLIFKILKMRRKRLVFYELNCLRLPKCNNSSFTGTVFISFYGTKQKPAEQNRITVKKKKELNIWRKKKNIPNALIKSLVVIRRVFNIRGSAYFSLWFMEQRQWIFGYCAWMMDFYLDRQFFRFTPGRSNTASSAKQRIVIVIIIIKWNT